MSINITKLPNSLRVITDRMESVDTVSVFLGVRTGSRNENDANNGISHFLEHMAFKGTKTRSYLDIAEAIDNVGGHMNAFTSKENTVYYIKLLKEDLELAIDILSDIFQNSIFLEEELEKERGVILQELAAGLDTPDDVVFDYYYDTAFKGSTLGSTIIGTAKNISSFKKESFENYIDTRYSAQNTVLSVCGNVEHDEVIRLANQYLGGLKDFDIQDNEPIEYKGGLFSKNKTELEQVQFVLGFPSISYLDDRIYTLSVAQAILGSGMSSRLFQEVREKRGLVYTVSCWNDSYCDTGIFTIYAGTSPEKVDELMITIQSEMNKMKNYITDEEMHRVIKQVKASIVMSKESTYSRGKKCVLEMLNAGRYIGYDEALMQIQSVSKDMIFSIMEDILHNPTLSLYGNLSNIKTDLEQYIQKF